MEHTLYSNIEITLTFSSKKEHYHDLFSEENPSGSILISMYIPDIFQNNLREKIGGKQHEYRRFIGLWEKI